MYQRPDGPLSIGGVLDDGFRLCKASFSKIFLLALISAFINQIPSAFMGFTPGEEMTELPVGALWAFALTAVISMVFYGAVIARVDAISRGESVSLGEALGVGLRRFFPILISLILFTILVMLGLVVLIIPGLIVMLTLVFAPYLSVTDKLGPIEALKQSHRLVWGNWWRTAAIFAVIMFIVFAAYFLMGMLGALAGAFGGVDVDSGFNLFQYLVLPLVTAIVSPLIYAFSMSVLNDLKLRREGGDLAERMEELETA